VTQHLLPVVSRHLVEPARAAAGSAPAWWPRRAAATARAGGWQGGGRPARRLHPPFAGVDQRAIRERRIRHDERVPEAREHLGQLPGCSRELRGGGKRRASRKARCARRAAWCARSGAAVHAARSSSCVGAPHLLRADHLSRATGGRDASLASTSAGRASSASVKLGPLGGGSAEGEGVSRPRAGSCAVGELSGLRVALREMVLVGRARCGILGAQRLVCGGVLQARRARAAAKEGKAAPAYGSEAPAGAALKRHHTPRMSPGDNPASSQRESPPPPPPGGRSPPSPAA
jgi:hypothetical protein